MAVGTRMQQRRATAAEWDTSDYVLEAGEIGVALDTNVFKVGNGTSPWTELPIALDGQYLPLLGTAANAALLGGVSVSSLVKVADTDVNPTNNTYVKRTADGGIKATDATENTEVTTLQQQTAAILDGRKLLISRTVTANTTAALTDINKIIYVNHSSLSAAVQVAVPTNATAAFPIGSWFDVCAIGAGGAKFTFAGGVTFNGRVFVLPNYGMVRMLKVGTDDWVGIVIGNKGRLPTIKAVRTGSGDNYTASYVFVPWDQIDGNETYNPDSEFFTIPASGLPTARRIICNYDGEYLFNLNFNVAGSAVTWARIARMTADNSTTGMNIIGVQSGNGTFAITVKKRVAAGQSFGVHHGFASGSTGVADAESTGGNPANFKITRLSD